MFGRKAATIRRLLRQSEELENEAVQLTHSLTDAQRTSDALTKKVSAYQQTVRTYKEQLGEKDARISSLEAEAGTARRRADELQARIAEVPNREQITKEALIELAQGRSDEGYDAYLKQLAAEIVNKGIEAYRYTLKNMLEGREPLLVAAYDMCGRETRLFFPQIEDIGTHKISGFNVLDVKTRPKVDFIKALYPFLDFEDIERCAEARYTSIDPVVRLEFRAPSIIKYESQQVRQELMSSLLPGEWEKKLEGDKQMLLAAYGFGFAASYYEDACANPLPIKIEDYFNRNRVIEVPERVLQMQKRAGLGSSPTLLSYLNECIRDNPRFSAGVLEHFNRKM
ncbi:MAG: hypothetical protein HY514_03010 [Candidatus Aenigmarchaeota archaeon]|nr:hypothetical protein [Candidatus Aenigmarchaeota archaeon]